MTQKIGLILVLAVACASRTNYQKMIFLVYFESDRESELRNFISYKDKLGSIADLAHILLVS
jgi:hypothetical protein